jgi:hypothetical protein
MRRAGLVGIIASISVLGAVQVAVQVAPPAASAAPGVWSVSRSPKLRVHVATGCPASVAAYQDVVNTFPGPPLVPPNPEAGIICRYGPSATRPETAQLERKARLGPAQAGTLASAIRRLNLAPPTGVTHCPADFGLVAVIGFSFPGRADVGLWYEASGCQTLDNGRIGAFEGGNPSFYNGFLNTIDRLSPPLDPE